MKVLLLLRHADSAEKMQGQSDHERSLTSKGVRQVAAVASFMEKKSLIPEKVIASSALRVKHTVDQLFKFDKAIPVISFEDELYQADITTYTQIVHQAGDCQSLLIVGHNPSITAFAAYISKTKVADVGAANLLVYHFKGSDWKQLGKGQCELMEHFSP